MLARLEADYQATINARRVEEPPEIENNDLAHNSTDPVATFDSDSDFDEFVSASAPADPFSDPLSGYAQLDAHDNGGDHDDSSSEDGGQGAEAEPVKDTTEPTGGKSFSTSGPLDKETVEAVKSIMATFPPPQGPSRWLK